MGVVRRDSVHAMRWTTRGVVKVLGDADVGEARLTGPTAVGGALTADTLRADGGLDCAAAIDVVGTLRSSGGLRARGPLHAGDLEVRGLLHVQGDVRVDRGATVRGQLNASSVQATAVVLDGTAEVGGRIGAHRVDLTFRDASEVGSIVGSSVRLGVRPPNPLELVLGRSLAVKVLHVEADTVTVEGVDVRFIRSPAITLGRNAHVTEYEGTILQRHPSARVGPESRSPPPHGLSR